MKLKIAKSGDKVITIVDEQGGLMGEMTLNLEQGNYELMFKLHPDDEILFNIDTSTTVKT